ncbi:MAG: cyanophycinase [Planctomycetes bacterium]|nr:cyanophycinase [Planctomycetota bacterium]
MRLCSLLFALVFLLPGCVAPASLAVGPPAENATTSTPQGWLLIVGGGGTTDDMYARAISLGGGAASKVVVFPQASELPDTGDSSAAVWRDNGAGEVNVADTKDEAAALKLVESASIIWFPGGVQSRLMSALGAKLPEAIRTRYRQGAVVGGTSAGAAVMSGVMLTGDVESDSPDDGGLTFVRSSTVVTARGLGLVEWAVIDQHFIRRRRFNRLLSVVLDHPRLVGIGIDERTAILVHDRSFEVIGESNVLVIDARDADEIQAKKGLRSTATGIKLDLLGHGMRFDL